MTQPRYDADALAARAEILDCIHRYARGMDRLDRDLVLSAYHEGAIDDHIGFVGPADEFVDWAFDYHRMQARHQHYITNHLVELDGETAHSETYYIFICTFPDPQAPMHIFGGRYVDRFDTRDGRWAIAARVCTSEWHMEAATGLSPEAFAYMAGAGNVSRDKTDLSYERPFETKRRAMA